MTGPTRMAALVSLGTFFLAPAVFGQSQSIPTPSQADFDACNKQAEAQSVTPAPQQSPARDP